MPDTFDNIDWSVSSDVRREIWRRVFDFANSDVAEAAIVARHGTPKQRADYQKQARQIRVSLLQAREFFSAAESSTLFTSPNHLYYGMVSLCSAIMLLNGSGEKSLDYLRKDRSNASHGLKFTTNVTESSAKRGFAILENSRVEVQGTGHFKNWYDALPGDVRTYGPLSESRGPLTFRRGGCIGLAKIDSLERLRTRSTTLLDLFRLTPDLVFDFWRYRTDVRATTVVLDCHRYPDVRRSMLKFSIASCSSQRAFDAILNAFRFPASVVDIIGCNLVVDDHGLSAVVVLDVPDSTKYWMPEIRSTLAEESVIFADEFSRPEIADAYRSAFGLSMLSRYHPDLWMACLESHCFSAKLIERFVETYVEKFPALALEYLAGHKVVVSNRPAPWRADV